MIKPRREDPMEKLNNELIEELKKRKYQSYDFQTQPELTEGEKFILEVVEETFHGAKLSKYKIPSKLIDPNFGFYYITLRCNDMIGLRKMLWEIPVRLLVVDKNDQRYTGSYRIVPEGKDQIYQYQQIKQNLQLAIPPKDEQDVVNIQMQNQDKSDKIVGYPIPYNYQHIGILYPNSVLDETFLCKKIHHNGIHMTYGFYRLDMPKDQVTIYSMHPWEEIEKNLPVKATRKDEKKKDSATEKTVSKNKSEVSKNKSEVSKNKSGVSKNKSGVSKKKTSKNKSEASKK